MKALLALLALVLAIRLPFLDHAIQGDDAFYLAVAQHAQVDPAHPHRFVHRSTGIDVDMRGHPHPPGNGWILGAILAVVGSVREPLFHAAYLIFSLGATVFAWLLARRFVSDPAAAVLVFVATPAFVVNGTSLESDLPFLCFWLGAMALWVEAVELDRVWLAWASAAFMVLASLTSYQALVLIPVAAGYCWKRPFRWWYPLALAPAAGFVGWQAFEWMTTGSAPFLVLRRYLAEHGYQDPGNKLKNLLSMVVHLGWMAATSLTVVAFRRGWPLAVVAMAASAAFVDWHPLVWAPLGVGVLVLIHAARSRESGFARWWLAVFFAGAVAIFFAGSARYLLPLALPLAVLVVNALPGSRRMVILASFAHLAMGLALAAANSGHWSAYRRLMAEWGGEASRGRLWTNAEWGLRHYAEEAGSMPLKHGQSLRPGDLLLVSRLGPGIVTHAGGGALVEVARAEVTPLLPLRLFGVGSKAGYSTNQRGYRAFDLSAEPADVVTLQQVREAKPDLSYLPMNAAEAARHILGGVYSVEEGGWRWTSGRASFLLRPPARPAPVEASFRLTPHAAGRRVSILVDGVLAAESAYPAADAYTLRSTGPVSTRGDVARVTLAIDGTFRVPPDTRELGLILTGLGFRDKVEPNAEDRSRNR